MTRKHTDKTGHHRTMQIQHSSMWSGKSLETQENVLFRLQLPGVHPMLLSLTDEQVQHPQLSLYSSSLGLGPFACMAPVFRSHRQLWCRCVCIRQCSSHRNDHELGCALAVVHDKLCKLLHEVHELVLELDV